MKFTWGWAYDGVNASIPRNTGPECSQYLSIKRHWIEGVIVCFICCLTLKWAVKNAKPLMINYSTVHRMTIGRQILQTLMTFTLGLELGFKLSQRSVIYILNPCHITSIIQVSVLCSGVEFFFVSNCEAVRFKRRFLLLLFVCFRECCIILTFTYLERQNVTDGPTAYTETKSFLNI